ncbi:porin OmpC [Salmonella enterica subsp. enterica serovar Saintpaul]|uniref:Porin OmpC n=12 Tax=Salmonella enterica TaxID=28901 RepID=A0A5V9MC19_SALET|nr:MULTISPECIES: porin OmpC [Salmonella]EAA3200721.1 porin OmpS2 [Salmonella enterica subsp. enterica serovar Aberdeen]EAA9529277.1 porin OmpS2 [Salmonella enterica subsp. enterica serovar Vitkin]EBE4659540.1 porin OmpC [Salmonella enterica subsp. enterica serovar Heidelberg]EBG0645799.1 porin OmpC [Salmonella enterica subsp. enterica serovar Perth]EBH8324197.1 porin OmpS2 [Salmonella enterica subsp. enterica serovar Saintpaul str. CFSAN000615]EBR8614403.1 porin OmpS2 [Salmonella enterica sub
MKRKVLALVIPALLAAGAAHAAEVYNKDGNKLDLYGKVDGLHYFSDNSGSDGDQTYVRFGFKGETQINDQLTGYGQWEYNVQANTTEGEGANSWTRLAFAGLKFGDYGSFDYGRNYGVLYDVEGWTDMLPEFGGDSYTYADNYMTGRANGVATYRNTDFFGLVDGLSFALQYQGNNENSGNGNEGTNNRTDDDDFRRENGDGFGISTTYDFGMGFSAGAAYTTSDRTNDQVSRGEQYAKGDKADAWTAGLKYDANNIYLATMYSETRNMTPYGSLDSDAHGGVANKTQNFEVTAQYQFDFGLRPAVSFLMSKGKDLVNNGVNDDKDLVKYADVGATYYFNKNFSTYVDYKINLLDDDDNFYADNGINTDDVVALGMVYQF